jgi:predicted permease
MPFLLQDLRYAIRTLTFAPGFTTIAVAVLALGIGANLTVFSLVNAFFLRPLPVSGTESLVRVCSNQYSATRQASYLEYRDRNSTLAGLAAFQMRSLGLRIDRETEHAFGEIVSGDYFSLLGIAPELGRLLSMSDDRADSPPAVVLSHAYWTRRFGASADVVGRTISLNDRPFTIVGVAGETFTGLMSPLRGDLWVPLAADAWLRPALDQATRANTLPLHLIGRLKPGIDRTRVEAELDTIGRQLRATSGEPDRGPAISVYAATTLHPEISPPVAVFTTALMVVVSLVLLIVCVNVANLVLARAAGRDVELAIRQSLGASRGVLVRQLLTEYLLISLAGAAAGLALALWGTRLVMAMPLPAPVPIHLNLAMDIRVVLFTAVLAIAATLTFGVAPAISASRTDLVRTLKRISGDGVRHTRLRKAFLVAQVAMSVLLLVGSGLFIQSFRNAQSIDIGFDASQVLTASIDLETRGYSERLGSEFTRALVERLEAAPDILSVNALDLLPLTLSNRSGNFLRDGDPEPGLDGPPPPLVHQNAVGPGHFRTLKIPLIAGRDFTYLDDDAAPRVAIVNETLARTFWPGMNAIGQRLRPLGSGTDARRVIQVVGVVRDSKYVTVGETPRPFMYEPLAQAYTPIVTVMVRGHTAAAVLPRLQQEVRSLDAGLAIFNVSTLADATSVSLLPARIAGDLLGALGILALALAALGIYGVLSFLVRSRTREIGLRVAIGATPRSVATMVVSQALTWTAAGAAIGMVLAFGVTR